MAPVVVEDALAQGGIGCRLVIHQYGGVDLQAERIGTFLITFVHGLPHHFGHVLGARGEFIQLVFYHHRLLVGIRLLRGGNSTHLAHAAQHILLAQLGPRRIGYRIKARRRLRQPRQHGRFSQCQLTQRLAVVDAGSSSKPIGALP